MNSDKPEYYRKLRMLTSLVVFGVMLAVYWLTVAPSVSLWDCPEYVSGAWKLEVGHPPGNPTWMLVERIVTLAADSGNAALFVNLSSGFFTALACMMLCVMVADGYMWISRVGKHGLRQIYTACGAGAVAGLTFGFCDSTWYSAVEAEVYAMSVVFTALTLWLAMKVASSPDSGKRVRLYVLLVYLSGLSIGVHQLNLLALPAVAFIIGYGRKLGRGKTWMLVFLSLVAIGCILKGMMPSTALLAGKFEILAVNRLGLPYYSGVWIYLSLLMLSAVAAVWAIYSERPGWLRIILLYPLLLLSGLFIFGSHVIAGAAVSLIISVAVTLISRRGGNTALLTVWSIVMLLTGYSVYMIIPLRGSVLSPANSVSPSDPFSFASYINRDQYGSKPLLYGQTSLSRRMSIESIGKDSVADYSKMALKKGRAVYAPYRKGAVLRKSPVSDKSDSLLNAEVMREGRGYMLREYVVEPVYTPELNMWFPRITGGSPGDMEAYADWVGMTRDNMKEVKVSEAFDSLGNPVNKIGLDGKRHEKTSARPTYLQNFSWFGGYQIGYMYMRYLMWNFCGRQNDIPSTGEVEHGNFITGIPVLDDAMLGAEEYLPPEAGSRNAGRNEYYMLPLLLGMAGIVMLCCRGRRGRQGCMVVTALFVMTGVAIVVYLNQNAGEARERDYSFLGSFMAYSAWIGFGAALIAEIIGNKLDSLSGKRKVSLSILAGFLPSLAVVGLMAYENYDDHDRSDRIVASATARNILESLEPDAIIFVDGDNFTFPLWYAQEVEGVRKDVTVINLSYMSLPSYAIARTKEWDGARGVAMTGKEEELRYGAFSLVDIAPDAVDTLPAVEAFSRMYNSGKGEFPAKVVSIPLGDTIAYVDMHEIKRENQSRIIPFRRLATIDIISANAASDRPRPVYWQQTAKKAAYSGFKPYVEYSLLGYRLGKAENPDSFVMDRSEKLISPNPRNRKAYLDYAPDVQIYFQRAGVSVAGIEAARRGDTRSALRLAWLADTLFGEPQYQYGVVSHSDSAFNVAVNLGRLLETAGKAEGDSAAVARGMELLKKEKNRKNRWKIYRKYLPERLKDKMCK